MKGERRLEKIYLLPYIYILVKGLIIWNSRLPLSPFYCRNVVIRIMVFYYAVFIILKQYHFMSFSYTCNDKLNFLLGDIYSILF